MSKIEKGIANTYYSSFDHIHSLIRSNSLEVKWDECDEIFRKKAMLANPYEKKSCLHDINKKKKVFEEILR